VELHVCKPQTATFCATVKSELRPVGGLRNSFSLPVFDSFAPGPYRIHVNLIKASNPAQLVPSADGSFSLSDYQRYGETRDFEVRDPG
jgi:hypothetical protein